MEEVLLNYQQFANFISDSVFILEVEEYGHYRYVFMNKSAQQISNLDEQVINNRIEAVLSPSDAEFMINKYNQAFISGHTTVFTYERQGIIGETKLNPITNKHGCISHIIAIKRDITSIKENERALNESQQRYQCLVEYNKDAVYEMDLDGYYIQYNSAVKRLFGCNDQEMQSHSFYSIVVAEDLNRVVENFNKAKQGVPQNYECTCFDKNGNYIMLDVKNIPIYVNNEIVGVYGIAKDITKQKKQEQTINFLAYNDRLTKLPNRTLLDDRMSQSMIYTKKEKNIMALLYIDLDGFKNVNDYLGHSIGDEFLIMAANRVASCLKDHETLARVGGDEFVILLPHLTTKKTATDCAKDIIALFNKSFDMNKISFQLTCSIGIAYYEGCSIISKEDLLKQADLAMYHIKKREKNNYFVYTDHLNTSFMRKITLENDMRSSIKSNHFFLEYQPIIDTKTKQINSVEALVRWDHDRFGIIPPIQFIQIAENTGLIIPLGEWVLRQACWQLKKWKNSGLPCFKVSVNVSVYQLQGKGDFVELVKSVLEETGLSGEDLELEITETIFMINYDTISFIIGQLNSLGVTISIDDFGTGYSSMSILKDLPVQTIKIDRSFVDNLEKGSRNRALIRSITTLSHHLNMYTVGEGVENQAQLDILIEEGCDLIQGYFLSRPVSPDKITRLIGG